MNAERTHFLAVGDNSWGKARTEAGARLQLRKARGKTVKDVTIYRVPADYYIDDYGAGHGSCSAELISGKDARE